MKVLLVDGYSLLYRAFFSSPPLMTRDGMPTGALYGFMRMLMRHLDDSRPDALVVALDAAGPTFRHDAYSEYKANRSATPNDLSVQTKQFRGLLDAFSIPRFEHSGWEADDVLGTLAARADEDGHDVTVVTGDTDALQLVRDRVHVYVTRRGVTEMDLYKPDDVMKRFGFGPELLPEYKGLRGDTSDNIPGVPGVGEKTAQSLIIKYGGLDGILEHLDEVTPPRIRESLAAHRESALRSRELGRIVCDLPLDLDLATCLYVPPDQLDPELWGKAVATIHQFEFKSLFARYERGAGKQPDDEQAAMPADEPPPCELQVAPDASAVALWLADHESATTALLHDPQCGLFLGREAQALRYTGPLADLRDWLADDAAPKVVHDAKTFRLFLQTQQLHLHGVVADSLIMGYLLDPVRQQHPLSLLVEKYLRYAIPQAAKAKPSGLARPKPAAPAASLFEEAAEPSPEDALVSDEAEVAEVAVDETAALNDQGLGQAACGLHLLTPRLEAELQKVGELSLFQDVELPLVHVLVTMETAGMLLDPVHLRRVGQELDATAARLQSSIWEHAGEEFNIGSTKQLQTILFDKLQLAKGRAIKTGHSTDVHTLEKLAEQHEVVRLILEYRGTSKLKNTYIDGLLKNMDPATRRIHTNLNQTGTASGRISSSSPNLQNIPIRTEQGRMIRKAFVAPPGFVLLKADYSQIELRLLAHITGDAPLLEAFNAGTDVHARTAAELYGVAEADVDSEMRRKAKMTNYAIAYGVSGFGLAKQLGTGTPKEATQIIKRYFETLPGVRGYIDDTLRGAHACGYVQTLLGRRRPLPELYSPRQQERSAAERVATNHPLQGTAADLMKLSMLAVHQQLPAAAPGARMTMQVHDELVFEVPEAQLDAAAGLIERLMREVPTQALSLRVPLVVDVSAGPNWDDATSWSL